MNKVRVVADTNVIRSIIHGTYDANSIDFLISSSNFKFSLAPLAFLELCEDLFFDETLFSAWRSRISIVDRIFDKEWPLAPYGRELAIMLGSLSWSKSISAVTNKAKADALETWNRLLSFRKHHFLRSRVRVDEVQGHLNRFRASWIASLDKLKAANVKYNLGRPVGSDQLYNNAVDYGEHAEDEPVNIAIVYEAHQRLFADYASSYLREKQPYNPRNNKKRGDCIDIRLLEFLPSPVIILTEDNKFKNRVIRNYQDCKDRIFNLAELRSTSGLTLAQEKDSYCEQCTSLRTSEADSFFCI